MTPAERNEIRDLIADQPNNWLAPALRTKDLLALLDLADLYAAALERIGNCEWSCICVRGARERNEHGKDCAWAIAREALRSKHGT